MGRSAGDRFAGRNGSIRIRSFSDANAANPCPARKSCPDGLCVRTMLCGVMVSREKTDGPHKQHGRGNGGSLAKR